MVLYRLTGEACIYKKVSGISVAFLMLYVDDILLIGNDIESLDSIKGVTSQFSIWMSIIRSSYAFMLFAFYLNFIWTV